MPVILLCLGLLIIFIIRVPLINDYLGFSSDMGSYLMTRNWVLGNDPTGHVPAHFRPPLIGVLLVPFTWALGDLTGSKLLAILVSLSPSIPMFILLRRYGSPGLAAFGGLLIVVHPLFGDIVAGGYVTLPALALGIWALVALLDVLEDKDKWWKLVLPIVLLVGMNQTVVQLMAGVFVLVRLSAGRNIRKASLGLAVGGLLSQVWLPFYWEHIPFMYSLYADGAPWLAVTPQVWVTAEMVITIILILLGDQRKTGWLMVPTVALGLLGNLSSGDALFNNTFHRAAYVLPVFSVAAFVLAIDKHRESIIKLFAAYRYGLAILSLALIVLLGIFWAEMFARTASKLDMLMPESVAAIDWIRENTPKDAKVWVHPQGLGWWIGGLAPRAWSGSWYLPLSFKRAEYAAALCAFQWRECEPYKLRDEFEIDYVLIDERNPVQDIHGRPEDGWLRVAEATWFRELWRSGPVVLYAWR